MTEGFSVHQVSGTLARIYTSRRDSGKTRESPPHIRIHRRHAVSRPWPRFWTVLIVSAALPIYLGVGLGLAGCGKSKSSGESAGSAGPNDPDSGATITMWTRAAT